MIKRSCEDPNTIYLCLCGRRYIFRHGKYAGWYHPSLKEIVNMNLYFERSNGECVLVKSNILYEEVSQEITNYVTALNPNYNIYYIRSWEDEQGIIYDVGSHTEFFILTDKTL